ncbi:putative orphan protein [Pseudoalteromonas translucida]|uniref:Orphan protein n=1 Tax=Pseudoalteromonas translucida (strain TAC 125) TaxID=326442 RepID=Q3IC87_PSET1|nr:putative orphan protein [Pseudoalteromonas translucida]
MKVDTISLYFVNKDCLNKLRKVEFYSPFLIQLIAINLQYIG